jgi:TfoX/Sxy family transcriptional regulator of competence genes
LPIQARCPTSRQETTQRGKHVGFADESFYPFFGATMASDLTFAEYVCDQIGAAGHISFRKMFGEYAIYCDGKVVALVCDNQFFLKPTSAGRALAGAVVEAPPYPGAKAHFLIGDELDDREWISNLVRVTERALPTPKPKKPKPVGKPN